MFCIVLQTTLNHTECISKHRVRARSGEVQLNLVKSDTFVRFWSDRYRSRCEQKYQSDHLGVYCSTQS